VSYCDLRRHINGLSLVEVLVASACFCACLVPLLALLATNQGATNRRLCRMKLIGSAELMIDCLASLSPPLLNELPEEPGPPPLPILIIIETIVAEGKTDMPGGPPPAVPGPRQDTSVVPGQPPTNDVGGRPPPRDQPVESAEVVLSHLVPGIGRQSFGIKVGLRRGIGGYGNLECVTVSLEPRGRAGSSRRVEMKRLICRR
jgi:hypothetical protein